MDPSSRQSHDSTSRISRNVSNSNRHRRKTAIHNVFRSIDKRSGLGRGQQEGGADQLLGFPKPSSGRVTENLRGPLGCEYLLVLLGGEKAWSERVDSDSLLGPLATEVASQVEERRL